SIEVDRQIFMNDIWASKGLVIDAPWISLIVSGCGVTVRLLPWEHGRNAAVDGYSETNRSNGSRTPLEATLCA
ncbi:hypothetical protein ACCS78_30130, partial [Rhizobium johnstonii]